MLSKMTLWDKILVCSVIVISLVWLGLAILFNIREGARTIEIKVYGDMVEKLALKEGDSNIYSFEYGQNTGYIEVKNGAVRMLEMDEEACPEGICSKTGWIKEEFETIVCMPNGITVNIKNNGKIQEKSDEIDIIAKKQGPQANVIKLRY